jgi:hypothetical protein
MAATGMSSATVCRGLKELVGDFKNAGRKWRSQGRPEKVRVHDFPDTKVKKAIPYGVYDLTRMFRGVRGVRNRGPRSCDLGHPRVGAR